MFSKSISGLIVIVDEASRVQMKIYSGECHMHPREFARNLRTRGQFLTIDEAFELALEHRFGSALTLTVLSATHLSYWQQVGTAYVQITANVDMVSEPHSSYTQHFWNASDANPRRDWGCDDFRETVVIRGPYPR